MKVFWYLVDLVFWICAAMFAIYANWEFAYKMTVIAAFIYILNRH